MRQNRFQAIRDSACTGFMQATELHGSNSSLEDATTDNGDAWTAGMAAVNA
jgi:hypothetical protein